MAKRAGKFHRVSQQDIAREAGVSRVTVSLVLAGKDQTSTETRKRVLEAAQRLRYRPNLLVQGMQTGRTQSVGVLIPGSMSFQGQIARGIHDELIESNYVPIQLYADASPSGQVRELEQVHRLVDRRVDGIIIWPADVSVGDMHFREIWEREIPLVTVDRETTTHADHIGTDEEHGGRLVAEHLYKLGHRRIAHLSLGNRPGTLTRRANALAKSFQDLGGECEITLGEPDDIAALARKLVSATGAKRPTAVAAGMDPIAMKLYAAAAELGLRVPQDLSVVGYADFAFAADLVPPLTTVRQDPYAIGRRAAQMVLARIFGRETSSNPVKVFLKPELIVRKSTAAPA
jgi:LacI family transcriptional regulator